MTYHSADAIAPYHVYVKTLSDSQLDRLRSLTWRCSCGHVEQADTEVSLRERAIEHVKTHKDRA